MPSFFESIRSGGWWISVGVASIVLNIVSNYLQRGLDRTTDGVGRVARQVSAGLRERKAQQMASERDKRRRLAASSALREYERISVESDIATGTTLVHWGIVLFIMALVGYVRFNPPTGIDVWLVPAVSAGAFLAFLVGRRIRHEADWRLQRLEVACFDAARVSGADVQPTRGYLKIEEMHGGPLEQAPVNGPASGATPAVQ